MMGGKPRQSAAPRARTDLQLRDLPDGSAVLDLETEAVHLLNPAAAYVLSLCDGSRSVADLVAELRAAVPSLSEEAAKRDVGQALEDMARCNLLA